MQYISFLLIKIHIFAVYFIFIAMIERKEYMQKLLSWKDKKVIKVVTGIRRCGKSTLLMMFRQYLKEEGIADDQMQSINLESIENEQFLDYHVLYNHVKEHLKHDKQNYIFLDEIQMVPDFQKAVDSLLQMDNVDIYLTGSNAYLLSSEIATLLSGRYIEIHAWPLSFKEYASSSHSDKPLSRLYRKYLENGSFPYVTQLDNREQISEYLNGIYNTIVLKDIVARHNVSDVLMLQSVIRYLADNIGNMTSTKRISDTLASAGRKISAHTVDAYVNALTDSFIFYSASRYDIKGMQHLKIGQKYYLADIGLRNMIVGTRNNDLGHILENIVFLELKRRYREVYVGKYDQSEIDFVTIDGNEKNYYQVSLSVRDDSTLQRELAPLKSLADNYPKYLLTLDDDTMVDHDGIKQLYALDWLTA